MEHRWGQREDVTIPVRLRWRQRYGAAAGEITNISASGAWVDTAALLPLLAPIDVDMLTEEGWSNLGAFVVRRNSGGVGIEWREPFNQRLELLPRGLEHLRVLARNTHQDAGLA